MGWFTSSDFKDLSFWGKLLDIGHHAVPPLACYLIGSFAVTTMLMKNHLMDNLSADYVRTVLMPGNILSDMPVATIDSRIRFK